MTENTSRRNFLKKAGLTAGATLTASGVLASLVKTDEIMQLNPEQKEFMLEYGKWMDDFIEVIRSQRKNPSDLENQKRMMALTAVAELWKPKLNEYMKDEKFSLIYHASIERMKNEI
jgi:hypothetical protein